MGKTSRWVRTTVFSIASELGCLFALKKTPKTKKSVIRFLWMHFGANFTLFFLNASVHAVQIRLCPASAEKKKTPKHKNGNEKRKNNI